MSTPPSAPQTETPSTSPSKPPGPSTPSKLPLDSSITEQDPTPDLNSTPKPSRSTFHHAHHPSSSSSSDVPLSHSPAPMDSPSLPLPTDYHPSLHPLPENPPLPLPPISTTTTPSSSTTHLSSSPYSPSRHAPASPTPSRRTSLLSSRGRSRTGSTSSDRPTSRQSSVMGWREPSSGPGQGRGRPPSGLMKEILASSGGTSAAGDITPEQQDPPADPAPVKQNGLIIRDYAFPITSDLYHGVPAPSLTASSSELDEGGSGKRKSSGGFGGWGGFSLGGFGWGSLRANRSSSGDAAAAASGGGKNEEEEDDIDLPNIPDALSPSSSYSASGPISSTSLPLISSQESLFSSSLSASQYSPPLPPPEDGPEPKGLYRALYEFEPVGMYEMGVGEGEVVEVTGRGGGMGWVLARRLGVAEGGAGEGGEWGEEGEGGEKGLVPESYLERVEEGEEGGEGREHFGEGEGVEAEERGRKEHSEDDGPVEQQYSPEEMEVMEEKKVVGNETEEREEDNKMGEGEKVADLVKTE